MAAQKDVVCGTCYKNIDIYKSSIIHFNGPMHIECYDKVNLMFMRQYYTLLNKKKIKKILNSSYRIDTKEFEIQTKLREELKELKGQIELYNKFFGIKEVKDEYQTGCSSIFLNILDKMQELNGMQD